MAPNQIQSSVIRQALQAHVTTSINSLIERGELPTASFPEPEVSDPRDPSHGDYACNFALICAKSFGKSPRDLAELLRSSLLASSPSVFSSIEVAGPGFLNFRLVPSYTAGYLASVVPGYEKSSAAKPLKINVEFVSVNPNGPITIGSGRGAAYGSTLCNVLAAAGHTVHREYYINDGVNSEQMRLFAESVKHFCLLLTGHESSLPQNGYRGDYVEGISERLIRNRGNSSDDFETTVYLGLAKGLLEHLPGDITFGLSVSSDGPFNRVIDLVERLLDKLAVIVQTQSIPEMLPLERRILDTMTSHAQAGSLSRANVARSYVHAALDYYNEKLGLRRLSYQDIAQIIDDFLFDVKEEVAGKVSLSGKRQARQELAFVNWVAVDAARSLIVNEGFDAVSKPIEWFQTTAQRLMLENQRTDLANFGTTFDTWFSEQSLHYEGKV
ncbi:MAG: hypothetical protein ABL949_15920, partial [Fimbriimonadaceae bacterium]